MRKARTPGRPRRDHSVEETSAGGIVVFRAPSDPEAERVLLIRDSYRNWGFPKGHLENGESAQDAALREVSEETGLRALKVVAPIGTIDWHFRFRGRAIHKTCHFYLMESADLAASPQQAEGISACRWETFADAAALVSYDNARRMLQRAGEILRTLGA